jgi:phospholipid transport system substrate-binding protein
MKQVFTSLAIVGFLMVSTIDNNVWATSAEDVIRTTTNEVLDAPEILKDPKEVGKLLDKVFSFYLMSKSVLGKHWKSANKNQKRRFIRAFRGLLIRTYSKALVEAAGKVKKEDVKYFSKVRGKTTTVFTNVQQKGKKAIKVKYEMRKRKVNKGKDKGKKKWRVYNVIVGGVSLVNNYRTEFRKKVKNKGLDALIREIKNRK